ncbi:unnamed protein product [Phytophthora lilii]|uniref:Unnamed protein product n=1 Tax=Phytophthora lilii TaxID=2077276 RepID=A0A9W6X071_9STRA|nr:unnamed protein product [Phytophthora lilii]
MDSLLDVDIDLDDYQTYKVRTCSGGYHYYFKYDERFKTSANVLPGVDVRNDNGCVFAGERYEVVNDVELADMPEELYEALHQSMHSWDHQASCQEGRQRRLPIAYPNTSKRGGQSAKVLADAEQKRIDDIKAELFQHLCANIEQIDASVIRDTNDIEFNTLLMNDDEAYNVEDLALLLRQTIIRVENNGDAMFYVKEINETKSKRHYVASTRFIPRGIGQLKEYKFDIEYKDDIFSFKLLNILLAVKKSINYKKVVLEPYGAFDSDDSSKRRDFNLFSGLLHKYENDFVVDNSIVDVWLTHLKRVIANNDEAVYNYLLEYFKYILVNPMEKTGTLIIVKGKQDEAVDNADRAVMNKFKNLITADEVQIEYKGKEPVTLSDFCNYIVISNNDFASFMEESDRRSLCLETNNMMIGNRSYFNRYWATLDNINAGKHIFHWLVNHVTIDDGWHPQDTPQTSYKQELKQLQAATPIKFLID